MYFLFQCWREEVDICTNNYRMATNPPVCLLADLFWLGCSLVKFLSTPVGLHSYETVHVQITVGCLGHEYCYAKKACKEKNNNCRYVFVNKSRKLFSFFCEPMLGKNFFFWLCGQTKWRLWPVAQRYEAASLSLCVCVEFLSIGLASC